VLRKKYSVVENGQSRVGMDGVEGEEGRKRVEDGEKTT
jgi:hypothetical protein